METNKSMMGNVLDIGNERIIVADSEDEVGNSFFETRYHGFKVLILAPHPDDEINVAGAMIINLKRARAEVFVAYSTNGDFGVDASIRSREATNALSILGVKRDHIIFLGYGDTYNGKGNPHIFNATKPTTSPAGKTETYEAGEFVDYAFKKRNEHSKYTRENFIRDLKDLILEIEADIIFCVDFDFHADHRMLSMSFEQVMSEILLREGNEYRPEIYKRFAYSTAFNAISDFYSENLLETQKPDDPLIDSANYEWSERVRFPMPEDCREPLMGEVLVYHNPIAKAIFCHKSQKNEWNALSILNSDEVYFKRRTDNLLFIAQIESTSGDCNKIRDFQIINTDDIDSIEPKFNNHLWLPDPTDTDKKLVLTWPCLQQIEQIKIYGDINSKVESKIKLRLDNIENEIILPSRGRAGVLNFDEKVFANRIEIKVIDSNCGLAEIEIFSDREPQCAIKPFIKITVNGSFAYDYFVPQKKHRLELEIYRFHIDRPIELSVSDGVIYHSDDKLILQFDGDRVTVRAEIVDEPEIYDQIKIHRKSIFYFWRLKLKQLFERFKIHFQRRFRSF